MSDDGAEKVVEASPDRKRKARAKGDVPVSQEANMAAGFAGFLLALLAVAPFVERFAIHLRGFFLRPEAAGEAMLFSDLSTDLLVAAALFVLPLCAVPAMAAIANLAAQQGIVFAPSRIKPDLKKVNPVDNAGKKFGPQALLEFSKNATKVIILTIVGGLVLARETVRLVTAVGASEAALPMLLLRELVTMFAVSVVIAVIFAALDIPMVRAQREKRLKMSHKEAQDEAKENEGDQNIKSQRRRRAEKIAMNRMLKDIETADVLVVNPTHYAVALRWDRTGEKLPGCVAKGVDEVALRLREAARNANVPIRDDPPCARSLYATVEIGDPIRPEHFAAVAAAIRFADRMRQKRRR